MKDVTRLSGEDLLAVLAAAHQSGSAGVSPRQLAEATGRDRKLIVRVVDDLETLGFAEVDRERRLARLGWRLRALAAQVVDQRLIVRGQATVEQLTLQTRESSYLVVRRRSFSVTVAEAMLDLGVQGVSWLGRSQPVMRGDAGPVLLMDLSDDELEYQFGSEPMPYSAARRAPRTLSGIQKQIALARRDGFVVLNGQVEDDVASVGAPVFDFRDRLVGALVIVGPAPRVSLRVVSNVAMVVAAAGALSRALGGQPWTSNLERGSLVGQGP